MCRGRHGGARACSGVRGTGYGFGRAVSCTVYGEEPSNELLQVHVQEELELSLLWRRPGMLCVGRTAMGPGHGAVSGQWRCKRSRFATGAPGSRGGCAEDEDVGGWPDGLCGGPWCRM
jgi:hypothetical protein